MLAHSSWNRFKAGNMVDIEFNFDNVTMIYLCFVNRVESIWQIYRKIDSYFVSLNFYYIFIFFCIPFRFCCDAMYL